MGGEATKSSGEENTCGRRRALATHPEEERDDDQAQRDPQQPEQDQEHVVTVSPIKHPPRSSLSSEGCRLGASVLTRADVPRQCSAAPQEAWDFEVVGVELLRFFGLRLRR